MCAHCYAEARDIRFNGGEHWGKGAPRQRTSPANWREPYRWNRIATEEPSATGRLLGEGVAFAEQRPTPRVFSASLSDWLDDEVPVEWLADLLGVVHDCQNLNWLLLTKRPENWKPRLALALTTVMTHGIATDVRFARAKWVEAWLNGTPPANVWIGTSVGDQKSADTRVPLVLKIPARIRFLSCEPMLGPVEFSNVTNRSDCVQQLGKKALDGIHWVICGGESGKNARPMNPAWARRLRDQCTALGVPFFFKQWGEFAPATTHGKIVSVTCEESGCPMNPTWHKFDDGQEMVRTGKKAAGRELDGRKWDEVPA